MRKWGLEVLAPTENAEENRAEGNSKLSYVMGLCESMT